MALIVTLLLVAQQAEVARDVRDLIKESPLVKCVACNGSGKELTRARRKGPSWSEANAEYYLPADMPAGALAPPDTRVYYGKRPKEKLPEPTEKCEVCGGTRRILPRSKAQEFYEYALVTIPKFRREREEDLKSNRTAAKKLDEEQAEHGVYKWSRLENVEAIVHSRNPVKGKLLTISGRIEASTEKEVVVEAVSSSVTVITVGGPTQTRQREPVYVKVARPAGERWIDGAHLTVIGRVVGDTTYGEGEQRRPTILIEPIEWR